MQKGKETAVRLPLQSAIFNLKFQISYKLQDLQYQTERLIAYRKNLVESMQGKVQELSRDNFAGASAFEICEILFQSGELSEYPLRGYADRSGGGCTADHAGSGRGVRRSF